MGAAVAKVVDGHEPCAKSPIRDAIPIGNLNPKRLRQHLKVVRQNAELHKLKHHPDRKVLIGIGSLEVVKEEPSRGLILSAANTLHHVGIILVEVTSRPLARLAWA